MTNYIKALIMFQTSSETRCQIAAMKRNEGGSTAPLSSSGAGRDLGF